MAGAFCVQTYKIRKNEKIEDFLKKLLTKRGLLAIIIKHCSSAANKYGGIAQLARAFGSYPKCHRFKSSCRYQVTEFR